MNKYKIESFVFLFLGLFYIDKIWAFICPKDYNYFWLNILQTRNTIFYILEVTLAVLSLIQIILFLIYFKDKKWWRMIYLFGGIYVFIDSVSYILKSKFLSRILISMYMLKQPYYNILWGFFVFLGIVCFIISRYIWNYSDNKKVI